MLHLIQLDSPVGDEREHQSHEGQASPEDDDETQHAILVERTGDSRWNTISYSAAGLWKAVNRAGVQCLHVAVIPASKINSIVSPGANIVRKYKKESKRK